MKKILIVLVLSLLLLSLFITGCGPKKATQAQLSQLEELKMAADQAEAQYADCQKKVEELLKEKETLLKEIEELKKEIQIYK
ncbi:MAG: hypothetical protein WHT27_03455 [candidate division WOR-3 bacterium]|jgi:peptidoglycan hydrolase CwlO-like protein